MSKFKRGDLVKSKDGNDHGIGIEPYRSIFLNGFTYPWEEFFTVRDEWLELISKGDQEMKEYQLGDKVDLSEVLVAISKGPHPEYEDGDLFVYLADNISSTATKGEVIQLRRNDNTRNPYFSSKNNSDFCTYWHYLAKLPEGKNNKSKVQKPVVSQTVTIYSDGVEVTEDKLTFDGKTYTRDELGALVKRYQEVLRRPVAAISVKSPKKAVKKTVVKTKKSK